MAKSRRRARELALRALYEMDITRVNPVKVIEDAIEAQEAHFEQRAYAEKVIHGYHQNSEYLNGLLAERIPDYDFNRIAAIDRNVLRIAAYELFYEPTIPPAVTINEAIEIAKKYSTAESGKFVNGVLGRLLADSPKVNWNPASAPVEEIEEPSTEPEPEIEIEERFVEEGSEEERSLARIAGWKLRSDTEE
jgi:transcription antitermination factor NusB